SNWESRSPDGPPPTMPTCVRIESVMARIVRMTLSRPVMRSGCALLQRAQIRRTADIAVIDVRHGHTLVDRRSTRFQPEIERLDIEHARRILVHRGHEVLERAVADFDAMGVLAGGLRVLLESGVRALLHRPAVIRRLVVERGRDPAVAEFRLCAWHEAVVVRAGCI